MALVGMRLFVLLLVVGVWGEQQQNGGGGHGGGHGGAVRGHGGETVSGHGGETVSGYGGETVTGHGVHAKAAGHSGEDGGGVAEHGQVRPGLGGITGGTQLEIRLVCAIVTSILVRYMQMKTMYIYCVDQFELKCYMKTPYLDSQIRN